MIKGRAGMSLEAGATEPVRRGPQKAGWRCALDEGICFESDPTFSGQGYSGAADVRI